MFRFVSALMTVSILAWVMPLGAFIKPAQESTACGGKRGMHMCSMMGKKTPSPSKVTVTSASSVEKASGASGNDMLLESAFENLPRTVRFESAVDLIKPSSFVSRPLGPPPRNI